MIKKTKKGYRVVGHKSSKNFGTYKTKEEAERRLEQIKKFRHVKKEERKKRK